MCQPSNTRPNYLASARMWRHIAHTAQLAGDFDAMRQAHFRAQENEQFAWQHGQTKKSQT